jgi:hypothetical protein
MFIMFYKITGLYTLFDVVILISVMVNSKTSEVRVEGRLYNYLP